jgi:hypothetical protein
MQLLNYFKDVIKEVCLGAEILQKLKTYNDIDSHLMNLLDSGYNFNVLQAVKRRNYGYNTHPYELKKIRTVTF